MIGAHPIASGPIAAIGATAPPADGGTGSTTTRVDVDQALTWAINSRVNVDLVLVWAILTEGLDMNFVPSAARTIAVQAAPGAFTVPTSGFWTTTDPKKPRGVKDPDSTVDVSFDWADWLNDISDAAATFVFEVGGGLSIVGDQPTGSLATVFVSGGTVGELAPITCRITSASVPPRVEDRTVYLSIEER
jgi:hypothetical protein